MNDEATIRKNIELWAEQYNNHDAVALAAWYTTDCVYITPTGMALLGPKQILEYFQASFKRAPAMKIAVRVEHFGMDKPDLAIARGTFEVANVVDPNGKPLPMKGPWVSTFVMRDGRWIPLVHASAIALEAYVSVHG
jgi:uncharacterized protein (TIGR02246 family)